MQTRTLGAIITDLLLSHAEEARRTGNEPQNIKNEELRERGWVSRGYERLRKILSSHPNEFKIAKIPSNTMIHYMMGSENFLTIELGCLADDYYSYFSVLSQYLNNLSRFACCEQNTVSKLHLTITGFCDFLKELSTTNQNPTLQEFKAKLIQLKQTEQKEDGRHEFLNHAFINAMLNALPTTTQTERSNYSSSLYQPAPIQQSPAVEKVITGRVLPA